MKLWGHDAKRERALQPFHPCAQVWVGGFEREVKMVPHHDQGVNAPAAANGGFAQTRFEGARGIGGGENIAPIVAAIDDVIARPGEFQTKSARDG